MTDFILWLQVFLFNYPVLQYLMIFLGAAFGGEVAMITLSFLAAQGFFPLPSFFLVSFLGTLSSDVLWFVLGRTKTADKIFNHRYAIATILLITEAIRKISRGNHLFALIFAKFLIGTRVVLILYVSKTRIAFKNFIFDDMLAILVWLLVLVPIGFLSGLGFTFISGILQNIYAGIGFVILILFLFVMLQMWLKRYFTREGEEILEKKNVI
ncbi:hypothetical protein A3D42_02785 [Candidatus Nomurabacteria bacterium RIFCSPHIGHO2_02_FULL_41_18]|uniref:DedA family protein n=1 Tax=Candidatus Nomurabacteria bacterium RIFCSPHIGHO2_02_FULL_41_18 TaxID=1801754 RepID=A0A1F6W7D8_9BACT|nr:MAG: hypothetical protein A2737_02850 [Candidatus Nomurabacteria bacterium RIFCSPHIGHO2_01_FULL_41_71]OGI77712.1 MAG: hypothetical protein A3D42_02785 [Candidatus Nomurabacteria bacterium RIFCSPHIGHO2_02_FULL_41_18]OGI89960.1 MAG: hypothetical protein A3B01_01825 [Candidatus Nomurabacteria bacterium RIFCSPLOWO2_01_FULL_41_52b]OGJ00446.1 MAG: hypothetical protein A3I90_01055 [Candidatus Nomurabacteria bacterium RIFCSPLOWO2_02_FULL_41_9]